MATSNKVTKNARAKGAGDGNTKPTIAEGQGRSIGQGYYMNPPGGKDAGSGNFMPQIHGGGGDPGGSKHRADRADPGRPGAKASLGSAGGGGNRTE